MPEAITTPIPGPSPAATHPATPCPREGATAGPLVVALAYDGLCTFEFGCAVEVFGLHRPEMGPLWYRFAVCAAEPGPLRAAGGIRVTADGGPELLAAAHTVLVPGWRGGEVPASVAAPLAAAHARGARIASFCSGVFVLAAAGLLEGRRATTHWRHAPELARRHPSVRFVPDVLFVREDRVLTAAGSAAALDLCLHLVRGDFGADAANAVAHRLVLPALREGGQAQRVVRPVPRAGAGIAPLLDRVRARLDQPWPVPRLAAEAALSPRGLDRRFREATGLSPGAWLRAARLAHARDLIRAGGRMGPVALACGFASAASLRRALRAHPGEPGRGGGAAAPAEGPR